MTDQVYGPENGLLCRTSVPKTLFLPDAVTSLFYPFVMGELEQGLPQESRRLGNVHELPCLCSATLSQKNPVIKNPEGEPGCQFSSFLLRRGLTTKASLDLNS